MWIHKHKNWPDFTWDAEHLASRLAKIRHRQGRLLGRMENLGFELKQEASLNTLTNDIVKSSAIEGEHLNSKEVRSSIARRLGVDIAGLIPASRDVEGIVEIMLDATQQFSKTLTEDRLFDWHAALFPTGRSGMHRITVGGWRTIEAGLMQVVSGAIGHEKIHFEAPSANRVEKEMRTFLVWFNNSHQIDPVLKAGIAHLWFVTIHPFEDGNGRIARAIGDMMLTRADGVPDRFYSLSTQIESERKDYYDQLEQQQRNSPEITSWLEWFLSCLGRAISNAENVLGKIIFSFIEDKMFRLKNNKNSFALPGVNLPPCSSFRPTLLDGQMCYKLAVNWTSDKGKKNGLKMLLDYNEDRSIGKIALHLLFGWSLDKDKKSLDQSKQFS